MPDSWDKVFVALKAKGLKLVTAESCTGGQIAAAITAIPGSSAVFERGFVTYSNESKNELLGVPLATLDTHGAVSLQTAEAMATGALKNSRADIAISVTGVAGPDGGSAEKPVGTVCFGLAFDSNVKAKQQHFEGNREMVQKQSVEQALSMILEALKDD